MPTYDYECPQNQSLVEVMHGIHDTIQTWGELCRAAGIEPGDTPSEAPVRRVLSAPSLAFPKTNSELKNLGFTKLVRRDKGIYENVTATDSEKRFMNADDPSSLPNLNKKIGD